MKLKILPRDVERELAESRGQVLAAGLPGLLSEIDGGSFGTTELNLALLEASAWAMASARAVLHLGETGHPAGLAALVFAEEALDRFSALGGDAGRGIPEGAGKGLAPRDYQDIIRLAGRPMLDALLRDAASFLKFYLRHPEASKRLKRDTEALRCLASYASLLARLLRRMCPEAGRAELETPRLALAEGRVEAARMEEPASLLPVGFDDIVGNGDFVRVGKRLARDVAGFDLKAGKNPKKIRNQILFVLGTPGCGKTVTAHAVGNYFLELCARNKVRARMRVLRRTDWASSYQNQSAGRLLEIFQEEVFRFDGVCGVYWPDIDTAFAARSDEGIRQEEKANLGTIFGILDGTIGPKNGKWFMICDANTLHMDEATLSRLSQTPVRALGPETAADYVKLLRDVKLRGKGPWLRASKAGWDGIGKRCLAEKISGRSVDNLAGRILTEIEDFDEPEEYFTLGFEEKARMIAGLSRIVGAKRVLDLLAEHCRFEREAQARSEEERFQRRVSEIRFHLGAQAAAVRGLGNPSAGSPA